MRNLYWNKNQNRIITVNLLHHKWICYSLQFWKIMNSAMTVPRYRNFGGCNLIIYCFEQVFKKQIKISHFSFYTQIFNNLPLNFPYHSYNWIFHEFFWYNFYEVHRDCNITFSITLLNLKTHKFFVYKILQ